MQGMTLSRTSHLTLRYHTQGRLGLTLTLTLSRTQEWLGLTDSLQHIANVALMEHRLPRDSEDSTLWEGEELTVRCSMVVVVVVVVVVVE